MKVCPKCTHDNPPEMDTCEECGADISLVASDGLDPLVGQVLVGKFHVKELIGQGAMGRVYRAVQAPINREVAIKILHQHLMEDQRVARRFQREAEAASRFTHPNSIAIFDFGQTENKSLYIAMEYIVGPDLARVISDDSPLPIERVIKIGSQVLSALHLAHNSKIIHRDLKPENIMLAHIPGQDELVKVCDFGIAKIQQPETNKGESALTMFGMICGTPYYMSPEQAKGEELDGRTDLYSMGVILYEMLTGEVPFRGSTPVEVIARHLTDHAVPPSKIRGDSQIPRALEDVVMRALRKNRNERFATAEEFRVALEKAREETAFHLELERVLQTSEDTARRPTGMSIPVATVASVQGETVVRPSSAIAGAPSLAPSSSSTSVPQIAIARGRPLQSTPHPMPAATPAPPSGPTRVGPAPAPPSGPTRVGPAPTPPPVASPQFNNSISAITQSRAPAPSAPPAQLRSHVVPATPPPPSSGLPPDRESLPFSGPVPALSGIRPAPVLPHHAKQNFDEASEPVVQRKGSGGWIFLMLLLFAGGIGGYYLYTRFAAQNDPQNVLPDVEERPLPHVPRPQPKPSTTPLRPQPLPRIEKTTPTPRPWKRRATARASSSHQSGRKNQLHDLAQQHKSIVLWMRHHMIRKEYLEPAVWRDYTRSGQALRQKNVRKLREYIERLSNQKIGQEDYIDTQILKRKYKFLSNLYKEKKRKKRLSIVQDRRCDDILTQIFIHDIVLQKPLKANKMLNEVQSVLLR